jgi:hypothetical protein
LASDDVRDGLAKALLGDVSNRTIALGTELGRPDQAADVRREYSFSAS